jgi:hypothetical protein
MSADCCPLINEPGRISIEQRVVGRALGIRPGSFINRQQRTADHWKNASLERGTLEKFKLFGT